MKEESVLVEQAKRLNEITRKSSKEKSLEKATKRLNEWPNYVWMDVAKYIKRKYGLSTARKTFSISKFLYKSSKFDFVRFVKNITIGKTKLLWSLTSRRLGIGIIKDTDGHYLFIPLDHLSQETLESLFETYKRSQRYNDQLLKEK